MNARYGFVAAALVSLLLLLTAIATRATAGAPNLPPPRAVPGITAADLYPHGCVDCHVHLPALNVDARFSTLMTKLAKEVEPALLSKAQAAAPAGLKLRGRHPPVPGVLGNIPASCNPCHAKGSRTAPPFATLLHSIHLGDGSDSSHNVFMTLYQGECTHCHKLDAETGAVSIPSGPEKQPER
jgi:hypothetical protein